MMKKRNQQNKKKLEMQRRKKKWVHIELYQRQFQSEFGDH